MQGAYVAPKDKDKDKDMDKDMDKDKIWKRGSVSFVSDDGSLVRTK